MSLNKQCTILLYVFLKITQMFMNCKYPFATCFCTLYHVFEIQTNFWGRRKRKGLAVFVICNLYFFEMGSRERKRSKGRRGMEGNGEDGGRKI